MLFKVDFQTVNVFHLEILNVFESHKICMKIVIGSQLSVASFEC